jgi:hypothetical protein
MRKLLLSLLILILLLGIVSIVYADTYAPPTSDSFTFVDKTPKVISTLSGKISDSFHFIDLVPNAHSTITTIYITITHVITVLGTACNGGSCYIPTGASLSDEIVTELIFPILMIAGTGFGFLRMAPKSFGILVMIESFVMLCLAYIGIIPSWFTLLIILFVASALARLIISFFGSGQQT